MNVIAGIMYFREIILASLQNVSETTPRLSKWLSLPCLVPCISHLPIAYVYVSPLFKNLVVNNSWAVSLAQSKTFIFPRL